MYHFVRHIYEVYGTLDYMCAKRYNQAHAAAALSGTSSDAGGRIAGAAAGFQATHACTQLKTDHMK